MSKPLLSIGMIFKNEIRCLERCLKSLGPLRQEVSCELVMADTGSDDGSREIAEKYADILIDFPWINDFSAARNAVLERCTGTWYLCIDADEWLEDITPIKRFLKRRALWRNIGVCTVTLRNYMEYDTFDNYSDFLAFRIVRRTGALHYSGTIHETFSGSLPKDATSVHLPEMLFHHDGYVSMNQPNGVSKRKRNLDLLKVELEQHPGNLRLLLLCYESTVKPSAEAKQYLHSALERIDARENGWDYVGPCLYRYAVRDAKMENSPELEELAARARETFPASAFTRVDVANFMFWKRVEEEDYTKMITEGEAYLTGLSDFRVNQCSSPDLFASSICRSAPLFEYKVRVLLSDAYFHEKEYEKALETLSSVRGEELEAGVATAYIKVLMNLQSHSLLALDEVVKTFWKEISGSDTEKAKNRVQAVREAAFQAFTSEHRAKEDKKGFRHSWTLFLPLEGVCSLGDAAALLQTTDPVDLHRQLAAVEDWTLMPVSALAHALECGASFPLPEKPLRLEDADRLAARLAADERQTLFSLACRPLPVSPDAQTLNWARALTMAAVPVFPWQDKAERAQGIALAKAFADVERMFLPKSYAPWALEGAGIDLLPPMHRFGLWFSRALSALADENWTEGVRLLRESLAAASEGKNMVNAFLEEVERHEKKQSIQTAPPELIELANKVKEILERYPPDDPSVQALKGSPVYQRVAWLLEEPASVALGVTQ